MSFIPLRRKRRPALACEQCRRRKIRCDRQSPCTQCTKANISNCLYVRDDRNDSAKVPFEGGDTHFSVFEQTLDGLVSWPPAASTVSELRDHTQTNMQFQQRHEVFDVELQHFHKSPHSSLPFGIPLGEEFSDMSSSAPVYFDMPFDTSSWEALSQTDNQTPESHENVPLYPNFVQAPFGFLYKGRFLAKSHWINYAYQCSEILDLIQSHETDRPNRGQWTFCKCKAIRKSIKECETTLIDHSRSSIRSMVPIKAVSDKLVQAYLRTFQAVLTILHVPSFLQDYSNYWKCSDPSTVNQPFAIMLLLILSIGARFDSKEQGLTRVLTLQWIKTASDWILSSKEKSRLSLDGLRIQSLLLLSRKINGVNSSLAWLCTGSLYRAAMSADLQLCGKENENNLPDCVEVEIHRRLRITLIEMDLQASMDLGCLPSVEDNNFPLPSNIEDVSLDNPPPRHTAVPQSKLLSHFTQSSLQILLAQTQPVRLKIVRFLNSKGPDCSFDTALGLSEQLLGDFKKAHDLIEIYRTANEPPTTFQLILFDLFVRRFILSLHHPFALKAISDPRYAYSRQICIDTSMAILSHLSQPSELDVRQLQLKGTGVFCDVYLQSCLYLTGEITNQIDTDTCFLSTSRRSDLVRREMKEIVERFSQLAIDRIAAGETNIKRYVLASCLLAQADARQDAILVQTGVSRTLEKSLQKCGSFFQAQLQALTNAMSMDHLTNRNNMEQHHWPPWDTFSGQHLPKRSSTQIFGSLE